MARVRKELCTICNQMVRRNKTRYLDWRNNDKPACRIHAYVKKNFPFNYPYLWIEDVMTSEFYRDLKGVRWQLGSSWRNPDSGAIYVHHEDMAKAFASMTNDDVCLMRAGRGVKTPFIIVPSLLGEGDQFSDPTYTAIEILRGKLIADRLDWAQPMSMAKYVDEQTCCGSLEAEDIVLRPELRKFENSFKILDAPKWEKNRSRTRPRWRCGVCKMPNIPLGVCGFSLKPGERPPADFHGECCCGPFLLLTWRPVFQCRRCFVWFGDEGTGGNFCSRECRIAGEFPGL